MSDEQHPNGADALLRRFVDVVDLDEVDDIDELLDTVRRVKGRLLSLWEIYDAITEEQARLRRARREPDSWSHDTTAWIELDDVQTLLRFVDPDEVRVAAEELDRLRDDLATLRRVDESGFGDVWEHTMLHLSVQDEIARLLASAPDLGAGPTGPVGAGQPAVASDDPIPAPLDLTETLFTWLARRIRAEGLLGAKAKVLAACTRCDALSRRLSRLQASGLRLDLSEAELGAIEDRVRLDLLERRIEIQAREIEHLRKLVFELNEERVALAAGAQRRRSSLLRAEVTPDPDPRPD